MRGGEMRGPITAKADARAGTALRLAKDRTAPQNAMDEVVDVLSSAGLLLFKVLFTSLR